jgi:hypothetical protein
MKVPEREFVISDAVRSAIPIWLTNFGPSGSGKTWTALEEATGIQQVTGGDIYGLDTEGNRMLSYADYFKFKHVPLVAPFGSLDYLAAINTIYKRGGRVIIIDSMSHEHESEGGMVDFQEQEVQRMSGGDWKKAEQVKMLAWTKPKAARRQLLNAMTSFRDIAFIQCFKAADASKPIKNPATGKTDVVHMGFMPIGGREFVYEATVSLFLPPASKGTPLWTPENVGERTMVKMPRQFEGLFEPGQKVNREHGRKIAEWAQGGANGKPARSQQGAKPLPERATTFKAALRAAQGIADVEAVWSKAEALRTALGEAEPALLDDLTLTYEARAAELGEGAA